MAGHRRNAELKGNDMQKCSTGCRLLLITPALLILLQVALALHHHQSESCYDDEDSLHSFPSAFYPDHIKLDTLDCLSPEILMSPHPCLWIRTPDSPKAPITVLVTDPPQSRAPPSTLFS
ncbi:MAG: hypothetical protein WC007_10930 [Pelobacteraceae bacterium]